MRKISWFTLVTFILISLVLSACSSNSSGNGENVLVIGEVDSLTGPASIYGAAQNEAIKMAVDEINEDGGIRVGDKQYKLKLNSYDDKGDASEAISSVRKLIDRDGVKFIVGWASSTPTMGVAQMIGSEDALMIVGNAGDQNITMQGVSNIFRVRSPGGVNGASTGTFFAEQGYEKVAVLGQLKDSYYEQVYKHFKTNYTANGGTIIGEESFSLGDQDMYTQLTKLINLKPDVIYTPGYAEQVAFVIRQARELGYTGKIITEAGGSEEQYLKVASNDQMKDVMEVRIIGATQGALNESGLKFVENYQERYGKSPNTAAIYGYDTVYVLKAGLEKAGSLDVDKVSEAIRNMEPPSDLACLYVPIDGKMFDENGQGYVKNVEIQWNDGKWEYIADVETDAKQYSEYMSTLINQNK
ncbi:ABC transporter substrate-binding protein [Bacillus sp. JJ1533]|uniref:ABC transporter substrate-binding protein n=1 Tax=Bacillus sp. JJ1533 TaxID=3122959 RepID=UPI0030008A6A